jgi:hypothetical protein
MSDFDAFLIRANRGDTIIFDVTVTRPPGLAATATVAGGAVTGVTVLNGIPTDGSLLTTAPLVAFYGGGGTGATATATIANGAVTGVVVGAGGTGYTSPPMVVLAPVDLTGAAIVCTGRRALTEAASAYLFRLTLGSGIDVTSAAQGRLRVTVPPSATSGLADWPTFFTDVEITESDGRVSTPAKGRIRLTPDASRV